LLLDVYERQHVAERPLPFPDQHSIPFALFVTVVAVVDVAAAAAAIVDDSDHLLQMLSLSKRLLVSVLVELCWHSKDVSVAVAVAVVVDFFQRAPVMQAMMTIDESQW
jgi:hypothetical protein